MNQEKCTDCKKKQSTQNSIDFKFVNECIDHRNIPIYFDKFEYSDNSEKFIEFLKSTQVYIKSIKLTYFSYS